MSKIKNIINSVLDYCALGLYLYVVLSVFIPLFHTGHNEFFGLAAFLVKLAMVGIAAIKILLSVKDNLRFALISACSLILGFGYYFFKYYVDVNLYLTKGTDLLDLAAAIIALHGISTRRVFRDYFVVRGTCFAVAVVSANLNIISSRRNYIPTRPGVWDMGMTHHNMPSIIFLFLALVWISLIKNSKYRLIHYAIILIIEIYLGIATTSRTSLTVLGMGIILLAIIYFYEKTDNKLMDIFVSIFSKCALISPILVFVISIGGAVCRNYYIYCGKSINKGFFYNMFSRFLTLGADFANHGIKLPWSMREQTVPYSWVLGGDISTLYSDNVVQVLVIKYGMVFSALLLVLLQYWAIKAYRKKNYTDLIIIAVLCVFSVMEHHVVNYMYNPFYFLISTVVTDNNSAPTTNESVGVHSKKVTHLLVGVVLIFVASVVCMMPVFKYQIQNGLLHNYFLLWVVFVICLCFTTIKIFEKYSSKGCHL